MKLRSLRAMQPRPFRDPLNYAALLFPLVAAVENKLLPVVMLGVLAAAAFLAWPWRLRFWTPLAVAFALILTWSLVSVSWSIDPGHSLERFARLALTVAAGLLLCRLALALAPAGCAAAARWLSAGLLIGSAAILVREATRLLLPQDTPGVIEGLSALPFSALAVLFILVLLATLGGGRDLRLTLAAIVAALAALVLGGSSAGIIALAASAAAFAGTLWLGRRAVLALAALLPAVFVATPLALATLDLPARIAAQGHIVGGSTGHRLIIWRYVADKIEAKPLLGWGLHAGRLLPDRENRADNDPRFADIMAVTHFHRGAKIELMPLHPHNAALQLWLELGGIGAVLYATLYAVCLIGLLRLPLTRGALAAGAALVVAVFVIGQLSFNVWQSWWLCAQFLTAAFFLVLAGRAGEASRPRSQPDANVIAVPVASGRTRMYRSAWPTRRIAARSWSSRTTGTLPRWSSSTSFAKDSPCCGLPTVRPGSTAPGASGRRW
jgi:O-antigen ligase